MALSGEQWLDQVFRPKLADVRRVRAEQPGDGDALKALGGRLWAQVEALADTGVLTDEQERAALAALRGAELMPSVRVVSTSATATSGFSTATSVSSVSSVSPPTFSGELHPLPETAAGPPRLAGVQPGPFVLGLLGGNPVTLVAAEVWTGRIIVDIYIGTSPEQRRARHEGEHEYLEWVRRQRRGEPGQRPRHPRLTSPLQAAQWELRDEAGTAYARSGGTGEWDDHMDRQRLYWQPAPPPGIRQVTLTAVGPDGAPLFSCAIPLP